jgi:hypothetical protein
MTQIEGGFTGLTLGVVLLTLIWRVAYGCWWWSP